MKFKVLIIIALLLSSIAEAQNNGIVAYSEKELQWADSVLNTLSTREKIAQLIMLSVYSNKDENYNQETVEQFKNLQLGGIIFMQGGPVRQALLCNRIQAELQIPALVSIDAEHGLAMRLDSTLYYPRAMALGAISETKKIEDLGREIGRQCQRLGIHVNFAPVLDVNVEPRNPIINIRSFGEDKKHVVECASAYAIGLQTERVIAVGKHFPGHGDTHVDSHLALPLVDHDIKRLNDIELYPFRKTSELMGGMLVAHLAIPALEPDITLPSTLSKRVVDSLLINKIGYKGLIFTDALNMRGVANSFEPGDLEVRAFMAGNDILLFPKNPELAINKIEEAVTNGKITIDAVNARCLKVLRAKAWAGLNHYQPIDTTNLVSDLKTPSAIDLQTELFNLSLTMLKNDNILPINNLPSNKILTISLGSQPNNMFRTTAMQYGKMDTLWVSTNVTDSVKNQIFEKAKNYNTVIIAMLGTNDVQAKNFGLIPESARLIDTLALNNNVVLAHIGNPYALAKLHNYKKLKAVLVGYKSCNEMQKTAAQAIFGGLEASGHLPVSVSKDIQKGAGIKSKKVTRLDYNEKVVNEKKEYDKIDSLVNQSIRDHVMPGCQLLFGLNGKIIFHKAYGYHTYDSIMPVKLTDLYDIASVTKVAATTTALMCLYEKNKFKPNDKLAQYVPMLERSNKDDLKINHILAHQAGLRNWIPIYKCTLDEKGKQIKPEIVTKDSSEQFGIRLTDSMFLRSDYVDTVYSQIVKSPVAVNPKYKYSDLGFYLFPLMISNLSGQKFEDYCTEEIFRPLGMNNTCFLPLNKFSRSQIVPSEVDKTWRHDTVWGYVNDQGAAMIGGISGHAGLFSNANDLAKLCQLWLNNGTYGDVTLFSKKTILTFTKAPFHDNDNRRALGFDKPLTKYDPDGPTCEAASQDSYGHFGFTGAYIWIDPKYNCFMVFLTNRTFPSSSNNKLAKLNIRTQIQDYFYQAIMSDIELMPQQPEPPKRKRWFWRRKD